MKTFNIDTKNRKITIVNPKEIVSIIYEKHTKDNHFNYMFLKKDNEFYCEFILPFRDSHKNTLTTFTNIDFNTIVEIKPFIMPTDEEMIKLFNQMETNL